MSINKFENLYDFFNYAEFCPLCRSRTTATVSFSAATICEVSTKELIIRDSKIYNKKFTINLSDNSISKNYLLSSCQEKAQMMFGKQCAKYHFFINGVANIIKSKLLIDDIKLDKYHFIRIHGTTHFAINGSFTDESTSVRMTTPDFRTREIILPLIDFDLFSKRKIDAKLRNIKLLG